MSPTPKKKPKSIRTTAAANAAYKRVASRLEEAPDLLWRGKALNQERTFEALCLWLDSLDPQDIVAGVRKTAAELTAAEEPDVTIRERGTKPRRQAR